GNWGDYKFLKNTQGVCELRIHTKGGLRIYFGLDNKTLIILLLGGNKTSQDEDIKKAKKYWKIYKEKNNE
ncbi:UNVERIFIED_CONTAM: hypothetical protein GTU68_022237, partial [Idotea baltica]|nr:hypothetical protein [Idotea baltica]